MDRDRHAPGGPGDAQRPETAQREIGAAKRGTGLARLAAGRDWGAVLSVGLAAYLALYFAWFLLVPGDPDTQVAVADLAAPPAIATAILLAWRASRHRALAAASRRAWRWVALAYLAYGVGSVLWAYHELVLRTAPFPSWADAGFLAFYPILLVGLLAFPSAPRSRAEAQRFWLDAATVLLGGAVVIWHLILRPVALAAGEDPLTVALALAYPVMDLVMLAGITAVLLGAYDRGSRRVLGLLVAGLAIFFASDLLFVYTSLEGTFASGGWPDAGWISSFCVVAWGAHYQHGAASRPEVTPRASRVRAYSPLPYVSVALVYGLLLVVGGAQLGNDFGGLVAGAIAMTGLVVVRQVVAVRENARLLAERAERAGEARFRSLVQNSSDLILVVGRDGTIRYQSPSAERALGLEVVPTAHVGLIDLVHPEDASRAVALVAAAVDGSGEVEPAEWRLRTPDGRWMTVEAVVVDLLHDVNVGGVVITARDVTERRALEEQLRQGQKLDSIGRLAGGIAHDFNNLLTAIDGYASFLLADLPAGDPRRADVEEIGRTTARAAGLTRQLLAFGRRQILQPRVVALNAVIEGVAPMLRRVLGEDVALTLELAPGTDRVRADPSQLEQVILNLVVNARHAMPTGGTLTLETASVELDRDDVTNYRPMQPGRYARLAVRDTGIGMDSETLTHVFEPFFTTKGPGAGTGLGLSTVYGIVKQSGGYIWAASEPGLGATFTIYLPRIEADLSEAEVGMAGGPAAGGRETILVVEDDEAVRTLGTRILRQQGYTVLEAAGGGEAMRIAEHQAGPINLLVTDVVMPGLSGRELAERLVLERPGTRVLYVSGYTEDAVIRRGALEPGAGFLAKPFGADGLARKVREVLDAPAAGRGGA